MNSSQAATSEKEVRLHGDSASTPPSLQDRVNISSFLPSTKHKCESITAPPPVPASPLHPSTTSLKLLSVKRSRDDDCEPLLQPLREPFLDSGCESKCSATPSRTVENINGENAVDKIVLARTEVVGTEGTAVQRYLDTVSQLVRVAESAFSSSTPSSSSHKEGRKEAVQNVKFQFRARVNEPGDKREAVGPMQPSLNDKLHAENLPSKSRKGHFTSLDLESSMPSAKKRRTFFEDSTLFVAPISNGKNAATSSFYVGCSKKEYTVSSPADDENGTANRKVDDLPVAGRVVQCTTSAPVENDITQNKAQIDDHSVVLGVPNEKAARHGPTTLAEKDRTDENKMSRTSRANINLENVTYYPARACSADSLASVTSTHADIEELRGLKGHSSLESVTYYPARDNTYDLSYGYVKARLGRRSKRL